MRRTKKTLVLLAGGATLTFLCYDVIPTYWMRWFRQGVFKKGPADRRIYLTFDDGPDPRYTPRLLDLLKKHQVKACFFLVAQRAHSHPELVNRMLQEGHEIGFHSLEHVNAWIKGPRATAEDFQRGLAMMENQGWHVTRYRPPWGMVNAASLRQARQRGLLLVLWNVMAEDWRGYSNSYEITEKLLSRVKGGSVICLHDAGGDPGAPEHTLQALELAIPILQKRGYVFTRLGEQV